MEQNHPYKKSFDDISIPKEMDQVILNAMKRGKRKMKMNKVFKTVSITAASCFIVFGLSINTIPAFADFINTIPILSDFAGIIKNDKGLAGASNKGFLHPIQKSAQNKEIEFAIDHVISDGKYLTISYTFDEEKNKSNKLINLLEYSITDEAGNILLTMENDKVVDPNHSALVPSGPTYGYSSDETKKSNGEMRRFKWQSSARPIPSKMIFTCSKLQQTMVKKGWNPENWEKQIITGQWSVPFTMDLSHVMKPKIYKDVRATANNHNQFRIDVEIYPTAAEVKVTSNNTLDHDLNFFLVDDKGNIFRYLWGNKTDPTTWINEFESCYDSDYKSLYLVARKAENHDESQKTLASLDELYRKLDKNSKTKVVDALDKNNYWAKKDKSRGKVVDALDENDHWVKKDENGDIVWKQPVAPETVFKVKLN